MPTYTCPNPNAAMTLTQVLALLETDSDFANFLATTLREAYGGDQAAIDCVDSYLQPTAGELQNLGVPKSDVGPMRSCTESGKLVLTKCFEKAPEAFDEQAP